MHTLLTVILYLKSIRRSARLKSARPLTDVLADRIRQAVTEPTLLASFERLATLMDCALDQIPGEVFVPFMSAAKDPRILPWLRRFPKVAAHLAMLKSDEEIESALGSVTLDDSVAGDGCAIARGRFEINLSVTCLSPLAHGGDNKSGNATLFRRMNLIGEHGGMLTLPFYGGNALRGQLRDLLADDFLRLLGYLPSKAAPPCTLWFFYAMYSGGALEEGSAAGKALGALLGNNGAAKAEGTTRFRDMVPPLSLLGTALGNRVIEGRICVADLRPDCKQWTGEGPDVSEIMDWTFLTRHEDHESHEEHHGMIANTEVLKAGTILRGGIDISTHASEVERGCLGRGLSLLIDRGLLGAQNRMGLGQVAITADKLPDQDPYVSFIESHRCEICTFLEEIGALHAHTEPDRAEP